MADFLLGPYLRKEKNQIFIEKWTEELRKRLIILENQKKSNTPIFSANLKQQIKIIEENL